MSDWTEAEWDAYAEQYALDYAARRIDDGDEDDVLSLPGYSEGFDAFNENKPISDNPYSWQHPERQNWHAGWMEAREHKRIGDMPAPKD